MPKESSDLLTKELICGALVDLMRAVHPHILKPAQFAKLVGTSNAVVMDVIRAKVYPTVETIEKWTWVCGKALPQFFYDLTLELPADIDIKNGYQDFYRLLTIIFESEYPAFVAGIESNLVGLAKAVAPDDPLVKRYATTLLKTKGAGIITRQSLEGPTSARASPVKQRRT